MIVQAKKLRAPLQFEVMARKNKRMIGFHIPLGWQRVVLGPFRGGGLDFKLGEGRA